MKKILILISMVGLGLTIGAPAAVMLGKMNLETQYYYLMAGTILWFATAPFWMEKDK